MDIKVGDKVKVSDGYRTRIARDGEVIKIGRVWVTVSVGMRSERRFRLDTQTDGTSNSSYGERFYTLAQWAEKEARNAALLYLRNEGIEVRRHGAWDGREVDLADLLRKAAQQEGTAT